MPVDTQLRIGLSAPPSNLDELENQLFVGHNFYTMPKHTVRKMTGPLISLNTNGANAIDEVAQLAAITNTKIICIQDHKCGVNKIKAIKKSKTYLGRWGEYQCISILWELDRKREACGGDFDTSAPQPKPICSG